MSRRRRPSAKPPKAKGTNYDTFMKACMEGAKRLGIENWKPCDLMRGKVNDSVPR